MTQYKPRWYRVKVHRNCPRRCLRCKELTRSMLADLKSRQQKTP